MSYPFGARSVVCRFLLIGAVLVGYMGTVSAAETIRVAVASNFAPQMRALVEEFEEKENIEVKVSQGSTGKLYAQIKHGAPYDLFFAADSLRPRLLEEDGIAVSGSRVCYHEGRLVLWSREKDLNLEEAKLLRSETSGRLAIANPKLAPYGRAAVECLGRLGLWNRWEDKVVRGENVAQTLQFVSTGNARFGFVAALQLTENVKGSAWLVPESLHEPILQEAVLLKKSQKAEAFLRWVVSRTKVDRGS